jgi:hypothetical protein
VSENKETEQSSAIPNDTTNVQQPEVEQPVVSPETTNEPLGQPTEVAPAENDANKSTTIPKEFETPYLFYIIKKNICQNERRKNYGMCTCSMLE